MATQEIEEEIVQLEAQYATALSRHADVHTLSKIWQRIKVLRAELKQRTL
jgi:hypothetical protein